LLLEVAHLHFIDDFWNENSNIVNKDVELPVLLNGRLNCCTHCGGVGGVRLQNSTERLDAFNSAARASARSAERE
jgi:hypothetical protein